MRRGGRRDPADMLELGGPTYMSKSLPSSLKRFKFKTVLKYVILLILGIVLHSIYKEIFKAHHVDSLDKPPGKNENKDNGIDKELNLAGSKNEVPGGRILDGDDKSAHHQTVNKDSQQNFREKQEAERRKQEALKQQTLAEEKRKQEEARKQQQLKAEEEKRQEELREKQREEEERKMREILLKEQQEHEEQFREKLIEEEKEHEQLLQEKLRLAEEKNKLLQAEEQARKLEETLKGKQDQDQTGNNLQGDADTQNNGQPQNSVYVNQRTEQPAVKQQNEVVNSWNVDDMINKLDDIIPDDPIPLKADSVVEEEVLEAIQKTREDNPDIGFVHPVDTDNPRLQIPKSMELPEKFHRAVEQLGGINVRPVVRPDDHRMPPLVTAATQDVFKEIMLLVASVQEFFPKSKLNIFDIDLTPEQHRQLDALCNVRMKHFDFEKMSADMRDPQVPYWRPIVMMMALEELGHITWLNPKYHLNGGRFKSYFKHASEFGVFIVGQYPGNTINAIAHDSMFQFIETDKERMKGTKHIEILAMFLHNTADVIQNLMSPLLVCMLSKDCYAPTTNRKCNYDVSGTQYAGCHLNDEAVMNVLLNNWFRYNHNVFFQGNCCFESYDKRHESPKYCKPIETPSDDEL